MPAKKKSSVTTKLIGFVVVIAVVIFGARNEMLFKDQQSSQKIQRSQLPIIAVPVDRNQLSQRLLPALPLSNSIEVESRLDSTILKTFEAFAKTDQNGSKNDPSVYELKLADQKAWGCQPRPASLASATKQSVGLAKKVGVSISQAPIVPGHDDPHLRYESQFLELAAGHDGQPDHPITTTDSIEFKQLPELFPEDIAPASLTINPLPIDRARAEAASVVRVPYGGPSPKQLPAPAARVARTWETGRY